MIVYRKRNIGFVFVHGFLGSADSWENFPLDLLHNLKNVAVNFRVYRFTLPSQGSYGKALVQLRNEIVLLSTQLDGLIFLCHSLGGLLVAQIFDKLQTDKVLGIIAFDSPYFGLSPDVSSVALSKTSQKVVDPVTQVASSVLDKTSCLAQGVATSVVNVGSCIASSTAYVSSSLLSSTCGAIREVSEITTSTFKKSSNFINNPKEMVYTTASYVQEIPGKTVNMMVEIPVRSWEVVGYSFDVGKIALNKVFYGKDLQENSIKDLQENSIKEKEKSIKEKSIKEKSIKEIEKEISVENIKTPLIIQEEKDLGTSLFTSPSDPWDSWIRLGLASVAIVSSGISYTTPIGFAKNLTKNLLLAHGVQALNEARKTIQFLYPPLWGDSVSSITLRMQTLADQIYFKCFYVVSF